MSDQYRKATLWACDMLEDHVIDGKLNLPDITFHEAIAFNATGLRISKGPGLSCTVDDPAAHQIVSWARKSPEAHQFCRSICFEYIKYDIPLPPTLKDFVLEILDGVPAPKRPRGRPPTKRWYERALIYEAALELRERFGLELTRNEASPSASAADAVAEALAVCGRPTEFQEVASLCTHSDFREFRQEFKIWWEARQAQAEFDQLVDSCHGREAQDDS